MNFRGVETSCLSSFDPQYFRVTESSIPGFTLECETSETFSENGFYSEVNFISNHIILQWEISSRQLLNVCFCLITSIGKITKLLKTILQKRTV